MPLVFFKNPFVRISKIVNQKNLLHLIVRLNAGAVSMTRQQKAKWEQLPQKDDSSLGFYNPLDWIEIIFEG